MTRTVSCMSGLGIFCVITAQEVLISLSITSNPGRATGDAKRHGSRVQRVPDGRSHLWPDRAACQPHPGKRLTRQVLALLGPL